MTDRPDRGIDDPPRRSPDRAAVAPPGDGLVDPVRDPAGPVGDGLRATLLDAIDAAMATQPVAVLLVEVEVDATAGERADRLLAERAGQDRLPGGLRPTDAVIGIAAGRVAVVRAGLSAPAEAEGLAYRLRTDPADRSPTEAGPAIRLVAIGTATSRAGDTGHDLLRYAEHAIADALVLGDGRVVSFDDADRDLLA